jgi:hypothetical protein
MCRPMPNVSINGRTRSFKRGCLCEKAEYEFANDQWTVQRRNFTSAAHHGISKHDELLDVGGIIEKHTQDTVKINGSYFWKRTCQFVVGE